MVRFVRNHETAEFNTEHHQMSLTAKGALAVLHRLQYDTEQKELHVTIDTVGDEGAVALGRMLVRNKSLKTLYVTTSRAISNKGAMAIANGLKQNWTLELFYLKDSKSGEVDVLVNRKSDADQWDVNSRASPGYRVH